MLQTHSFEKKLPPLSSCEHFLKSTVPSFCKLSFHHLLRRQQLNCKKKWKSPKERKVLYQDWAYILLNIWFLVSHPFPPLFASSADSLQTVYKLTFHRLHHHHHHHHLSMILTWDQYQGLFFYTFFVHFFFTCHPLYVIHSLIPHHHPSHNENPDIPLHTEKTLFALQTRPNSITWRLLVL